jgi:hypothetical protein
MRVATGNGQVQPFPWSEGARAGLGEQAIARPHLFRIESCDWLNHHQRPRPPTTLKRIGCRRTSAPPSSVNF